MSNDISIIPVRSRAEYIANLELATPDETLEQLPIDELNLVEDDASAKAVAGSTVSFDGTVGSVQQKDVLNSTLLAQLAANKAFDREKQTVDWYKKYREVLENIGWVIQNFTFSNQASSGATVRLDKTALTVLAAAMSGNELAILTSTISALENADPDSKEITLFDTNGSSGDGGNFQLSTASLDPNNNVQMSLGAFYFEASERHTRFLFWSWSTKSINIYGGSQSVVLNEEIYSTVRQQIIEKLGDRAQQYVADIEI